MFLHRSAIDPVTYGWHRDELGWHFVVDVPSWVSPSDRLDLVQWLENYAKTIRKERPLWVVQFRPVGNGFILDARPSRDPHEFFEYLVRLSQENTYAA
jgi:hypothetical protein